MRIQGGATRNGDSAAPVHDEVMFKSAQYIRRISLTSGCSHLGLTNRLLASGTEVSQALFPYGLTLALPIPGLP
jgi:hypothetical protein